MTHTHTRYSKKITFADAVMAWHGLTAEQQALVVLDEHGFPYLAGVPGLTEKAIALHEAVVEGELKPTAGGVSSPHYPDHEYSDYAPPTYPTALGIVLLRSDVKAWLVHAEARALDSSAPLIERPLVPPKPASADTWMSHAQTLAHCRKSGRKLGSSTIYANAESGKFPKEKVVDGRKLWNLHDVNEWITCTGPWRVQAAPALDAPLVAPVVPLTEDDI